MTSFPHGHTLQAAKQATPIAFHLDQSVGATLRSILVEDPLHFVESDATKSDVIIFATDDIDYIDQSELYRANKAKCICITDNDIPTFRLPGLYASNERSILTKGRAKTTSYFDHERTKANPDVERLSRQQVEKEYLYSFIGASNSWTRKRLFRYIKTASDTLVEPTNSYNPSAIVEDDIEAAKARQTPRFAHVMAASKFALCPRGCGVGSHRLFESMALGVAPVIMSDRWRPIDEIDWSFAIFLPERHLPDTDRIVRSHESEWQERGSRAKSAYADKLARTSVNHSLHGQITALLASYDPRREAIMAHLSRLRVAKRNAYWSAYRQFKRVVLKGFHVSGLPLPITLHQPIEAQLNSKKPV